MQNKLHKNIQIFILLKNKLHDFKLKIFLVISFLLLAKASTFGIPFLLKEIIDELSVNEKRIYFILPFSLIISYCLLNIAHIVFKELKDYLSTNIIQKIIKNINQDIFKHLNSLSLQFHVTKKTGEVIKDIDRGVAGLQSLTSLLLDSFIPTAVEFCFVIIYFAWAYSIWFSVILCGTLAIYIAYTGLATERWANARRYINMADSDANQKLLETLLNYETVKYFGREELEFNQYKKYMEEFYVTTINSQKNAAVISVGQQIIVSLGLTLIVWQTATSITNHSMTVGDMVLVNSLMIQIYIPLSYFGSFYKQIKQSVIDIEKLFLLFAEEHKTVSDNVSVVEFCEDKFGSKIEFRDINFSYNRKELTLKNVSFTVEPGTCTAIVGTTGSGKSTITKLLFRFYEPSGGMIKINNENIKKFSIESLRKSIGIIPQDISLFNETIKYNIAYGDINASFEDIQNAARLAQLHDFILSLPQQYNTIVGERGLTLSGGERQRLAIARAVIKNPSIFIFDEATSSLDINTEIALQEKITELFHNRTSIIIAHRLSTIAGADQILVMKHGEIIEIGNHDSLIQARGRYYEMWDKQRESY